jgi:hypothetical protein
VTLTKEQRALWDRMALSETGRDGDQPGFTVAQARHVAVASYLGWCALDGIELPDRETLEAAFDRDE